ncbi:MAG TPA: class I SAM-dependent methyltransferase [Diaminobutyricibacter sp.]
MNDMHLQFLASPDWAKMLETDLLPWILQAADLGDDVLEIGPRPGLTTDILRERVAHVTAVELDDDLAGKLADRLKGTNVDVVHADATESGLPSNRFTTAASFSMLHHMPERQLHDQLFAEVFRMLRPGGRFFVADAVDHEMLREFHVDDTFVPVDTDTLDARLQEAGFAKPEIALTEYEVRFSATKK